MAWRPTRSRSTRSARSIPSSISWRRRSSSRWSTPSAGRRRRCRSAPAACGPRTASCRCRRPPPRCCCAASTRSTTASRASASPRPAPPWRAICCSAAVRGAPRPAAPAAQRHRLRHAARCRASRTACACSPSSPPRARSAAGPFAHRELGVITFEVDDLSAEDLANGLDHIRAMPGVHDVVQSRGLRQEGPGRHPGPGAGGAGPARRRDPACFAETTTIGLRFHMVQGAALPRGFDKVDVDGRDVADQTRDAAGRQPYRQGRGRRCRGRARPCGAAAPAPRGRGSRRWPDLDEREPR